MDKQKSYYTVYSIFIGIPFGIGMLVGWYLFISSYPKTVDGFTMHSGKCQYLGDTLIFAPTKRFPDLYSNYLGMVINDSLYITELTVNKTKIKDGFNKKFMNNSIITVWYEVYNQKNYIQQVSIDGRIILEYKRPYIRSLFFLVPGLIFLIMCSGYLYERIKESDFFK
jgi:hypothetical protein